MRFISLCCLLLAALAATAGCARHEATPNKPAHILSEELVHVGYTIADSLERNLSQNISKEQPIIVASFVNVDNLTQSSTFGRMLAEHVSSRLAMKGYTIVELKLRHSTLFIQEGKGEFMLSRDVRDIGTQHNASAIVVGTYGVTDDYTYVSSRIVRAEDSRVLSSCDVSVVKEYGKQDFFGEY